MGRGPPQPSLPPDEPDGEPAALVPTSCFTDLPNDEVVTVLECLSFRDRCRTLSVSKGLRASAVGAPTLWTKCMLGVCERMTNSVLQLLTSYGRGQLTHIEVINAPLVTEAGLAQAFRENPVQFFDIRGCNVNYLHLDVPRKETLLTCRVGPQSDSVPVNVLGLCCVPTPTRGRRALTISAVQPCKERCRAMLPCYECTGFDATICGECDVGTAPWRACRHEDCDVKLCDDCVTDVCTHCDKGHCDDVIPPQYPCTPYSLDLHSTLTCCVQHEGGGVMYQCADCDLNTCEDCAFEGDRFVLFCCKCDKVNCDDCAFKGGPFLTCKHCYETQCFDCAMGDIALWHCSQCCESSCQSCAFSGGHYQLFCDECHTQDCSDCAFKDGRFWHFTEESGKSYCSTCVLAGKVEIHLSGDSDS